MTFRSPGLQHLSNCPRHILPLLLFPSAWALFFASSTLAQDWHVYSNPRFGTRAEVPRDWSIGPDPANDDGRVFTSPDGKARITVSGSLHVLDSIDEAMTLYQTPKDGERITYKRRGRRASTVSGIKDARIFYGRAILSCRDQIWNSVAITYPAAQKRDYDALVTRVARSLRGGQGWQVENCGPKDNRSRS